MDHSVAMDVKEALQAILGVCRNLGPDQPSGDFILEGTGRHCCHDPYWEVPAGRSIILVPDPYEIHDIAMSRQCCQRLQLVEDLGNHASQVRKVVACVI